MINSAQFNEIFENEKFCRGCDADERHIPSSNSIKQIEQMSRIESLERWSHVIPVSPSLCLSLARSLSLTQTTPLSSPPITPSDDPTLRYRGQSLALRSWDPEELPRAHPLSHRAGFDSLNRNKGQDGSNTW